MRIKNLIRRWFGHSVIVVEFNSEKEAKRQIFNAVKAFCHREIILKERIYGIISCPRQHVAFNDSIFTDVYETTRLKRFTGIRYYATNDALIIDDLRVRPEI